MGNPKNGGVKCPLYGVQWQEGDGNKSMTAALSLGADIAGGFSKEIDDVVSNIVDQALDLNNG